MRYRSLGVLVGLGALCAGFTALTTPADAAYIVNINQVGSDVVATGSGSLNISDLGDTIGGGTFQPLIAPDNGEIVSGQYFGQGDVYAIAPSSISFGTGNVTYGFTGSGPIVGIDAISGGLFVPAGYVSGTSLGVSTATFGGTFADLGLTDGSYKISFGSGADVDTFTVNVGVSAVPLPASAPLFGAALLGLGAVGYGLKRRNKTAMV